MPESNYSAIEFFRKTTWVWPIWNILVSDYIEKAKLYFKINMIYLGVISSQSIGEAQNWIDLAVLKKSVLKLQWFIRMPTFVH